MWIHINERRRRLLACINAYIKSNGYSPTIRDLVEMTDFTSTSVVSYNLDRLIEGGLLKRKPGSIRGLSDVIVPEADHVLAIHAIPTRRRRRARPPAPTSIEPGCAYCGAATGILERDHFYPVSLGGSNHKTNIVAACHPCNAAKHNKEPVKWVLDTFGQAKLSEIIASLHSLEP